jgi:hypothetical protein
MFLLVIFCALVVSPLLSTENKLACFDPNMQIVAQNSSDKISFKELLSQNRATKDFILRYFPETIVPYNQEERATKKILESFSKHDHSKKTSYEPQKALIESARNDEPIFTPYSKIIEILNKDIPFKHKKVPSYFGECESFITDGPKEYIKGRELSEKLRKNLLIQTHNSATNEDTQNYTQLYYALLHKNNEGIDKELQRYGITLPPILIPQFSQHIQQSTKEVDFLKNYQDRNPNNIIKLHKYIFDFCYRKNSFCLTSLINILNNNHLLSLQEKEHYISHAIECIQEAPLLNNENAPLYEEIFLKAEKVTPQENTDLLLLVYSTGIAIDIPEFKGKFYGLYEKIKEPSPFAQIVNGIVRMNEEFDFTPIKEALKNLLSNPAYTITNTREITQKTGLDAHMENISLLLNSYEKNNLLTIKEQTKNLTTQFKALQLSYCTLIVGKEDWFIESQKKIACKETITPQSYEESLKEMISSAQKGNQEEIVKQFITGLTYLENNFNDIANLEETIKKETLWSKMGSGENIQLNVIKKSQKEYADELIIKKTSYIKALQKMIVCSELLLNQEKNYVKNYYRDFVTDQTNRYRRLLETLPEYKKKDIVTKKAPHTKN